MNTLQVGNLEWDLLCFHCKHSHLDFGVLQLYVDLCVNKKLAVDFAQQASHFKLGLDEIAQPGWNNRIKAVTVADINFFLGAGEIDVAAWRAHTDIYAPEHTSGQLTPNIVAVAAV